MAKGRYEVTVKRSRKIVERHYFNDYDACMNFLDEIEYKYSGTLATVEYKDLDPFNKGY
jgi:hypothetical protein